MENWELLQDIHDKVSGIGETVARLDEKMTVVGKASTDHETRLRSIEKKIYVFSGASAVVGWLAGRMWK